MEKVILKRNFPGFGSEKFKICVNKFPENVKNDITLILWLKKGGGLVCEGVLYAGFVCGHVELGGGGNSMCSKLARIIFRLFQAFCILLPMLSWPAHIELRG